jgi:dTDP-4-dehydrorhamnose 3,5-epimerase
MKILNSPFAGAFVLELEPYSDPRGMFSRVFCQEEFRQIGHSKQIVQINHSLTKKRGAIRGMHFQYPPRAETKIVRCLVGSVFDVMIDLRPDSSSFLGWHGETLSPNNHKMMYIPERFAHGFQTLEDNVELLYMHTEYYSPGHEGGVRYDDPRIGVPWPLRVTEVSPKDGAYPLLPSDFSGIKLQ